jgi:hypothetical protein
MASARARTRAHERIVALGEAGLDDSDLRRQILTVLGEVIAFDFFAWLLTDPVTAVGAAPLAEVPRASDLPALIKAKYATSVNRWTILLRQSPPVRLLSEATGGELARSRVAKAAHRQHAGLRDVHCEMLDHPRAKQPRYISRFTGKRSWSARRSGLGAGPGHPEPRQKGERYLSPFTS